MWILIPLSEFTRLGMGTYLPWCSMGLLLNNMNSYVSRDRLPLNVSELEPGICTATSTSGQMPVVLVAVVWPRGSGLCSLLTSPLAHPCPAPVVQIPPEVGQFG